MAIEPHPCAAPTPVAPPPADLDRVTTVADWLCRIVTAAHERRPIHTWSTVLPDADACVALVRLARRLADRQPIEPDLGRRLALFALLQAGFLDPPLEPVTVGTGEIFTLVSEDGRPLGGRVAVDPDGQRATAMIEGDLRFLRGSETRITLADGSRFVALGAGPDFRLVGPDGQPCRARLGYPALGVCCDMALLDDAATDRRTRAALAVAATVCTSSAAIRQHGVAVGHWRFRNARRGPLAVEPGMIGTTYERVEFDHLDRWAVRQLERARTPAERLLWEALRRALRAPGIHLHMARLPDLPQPPSNAAPNLAGRIPEAIPLGLPADTLLRLIPAALEALARESHVLPQFALLHVGGAGAVVFLTHIPDGDGPSSVVHTPAFASRPLILPPPGGAMEVQVHDMFMHHAGRVLVLPGAVVARLEPDLLALLRADGPAAALAAVDAVRDPDVRRLCVYDPKLQPWLGAALGDLSVETAGDSGLFDHGAGSATLILGRAVEAIAAGDLVASRGFAPIFQRLASSD